MSSPLVSVIIPAYNADETLVQAVRSALAQTVSELEVVVVDDGSRVPVARVLGEIDDNRLSVLRSQVNRGVSAARNMVLEASRAPLVAQLDADDLWHPDHLEALRRSFDDPEIGLAYTNVEIVGSPLLHHAIVARSPGDGLPDWVSDRARHPVDELDELYRVNPIPSPGVMMRADAMRAVGGYPRWLCVGEEYYLYIKLRRAGWRFAYVDRASAIYRWPEPSRGASFNAGRNARQNLKLFAALALRDPANAAIRRRLGGEIANVIATSVPGSLPLARRVKRLARRA